MDLRRSLRTSSPSGPGASVEVEEVFVHAAELLDAEVAIRDALEPPAPRARCQRQQGIPDDTLVERHGVGERRVHGREEPAVEGRHAQSADPAPALREAGDGLQGFPHADRARQHFDRSAQRLDRVAVAIDRVPAWHQAARLGKQQKQDPIDDHQRFVERGDPNRAGVVAVCRCRRATAAGDRERPRQVLQRGMHTLLQRGAHRRAMLLGQLDGAVEQRPRVGARPGHRGGAQQSPEHGKSLFALHRDLDVEFDEPPRVRPSTVDNPEARPGQAEAPSLALTDAETHGISPRRRRGLTPERDEQRRPGHSILFEHGAETLRRGIARDDVIAECGEKGFA